MMVAVALLAMALASAAEQRSTLAIIAAGACVVFGALAYSQLLPLAIAPTPISPRMTR